MLSYESSFTSPVISPEEKIVLAHMDYFKAQFRDGLAVPMFLRPLVMPNVTTFSLVRADSFGPELSCDMPALIGIIRRSEGMRHIRHLEIDASFAVLDTGVLLELLPSLESISIKSGRLDYGAIKQLSRCKLGPRLCDIRLDILHDADQILSMVESRYDNATQSPDINDTLCPFKSIRIPCEATGDNESLYHEMIKLLSEKCNTRISLYIDEDEDSEDEYRYEG